MNKTVLTLPVLPLRDTVLFPGSVAPLLVGRERSVAALDACMKQENNMRRILLVAQKVERQEDPLIEDLYTVGVIADVLQMVQGDNDLFRLLIDAKTRAKVGKITLKQGYYRAQARELESFSTSRKLELAMARNLLDQFATFAKENDADMNRDAFVNLRNVADDPGRMVDLIIPHLFNEVKVKQELLEELSVSKRLKMSVARVSKELSTLKMERRLRSRVKKQMEKSQREYYLNEHMKAIQHELGKMEGRESNEVDQLEKKLRATDMPKDALKKALSELNKLKMMSPVSAEASVVRGYLDWMLTVPWGKCDKISLDLNQAREMLDQDHHGLDEIKGRVMEYLAVHNRVKKIRGSVICLVGPPGVGKTSLGASIARGTNREYVRLSLGGVRDEAEIRGHRRTYIGAMPGKILQKMGSAGTVNPLFLLDEVDKMGMDYRGDPAAALLEVLDPEQNHAFNDHYLEVGYDLSEVLFICTANTLAIPPALLDRMEVIRIPGYTEDEKQVIAERYLLPRQMTYSGLKKSELKVKPETIRDLIRYYTREAGVRSLERHLAKICRKVLLGHSVDKGQKESGDAKDKQDKKAQKPVRRSRSATVSPTTLHKYCGTRKYDPTESDKHSQVGQVCGLAWTDTGGELLTIEATVVPGKARQVLTGSLGRVMKESIKAAMTVARARAPSLGIEADFLETTDVHVHVPEGATPKDGPSAGVCMCLALLSALSNVPVKATVAMTGEITLHGRVLPIGGLKEKLLAARRANYIEKVIIPARNKKDLNEIPDDVKSALEIVTVSWIDEVLTHAMEHSPQINIKKSGQAIAKVSPRGRPVDDTARLQMVDKRNGARSS